MYGYYIEVSGHAPSQNNQKKVLVSPPGFHVVSHRLSLGNTARGALGPNLTVLVTVFSLRHFISSFNRSIFLRLLLLAVNFELNLPSVLMLFVCILHSLYNITVDRILHNEHGIAVDSTP